VKALLQRVSEARVVIATETVGQMGRGLLVLVCAERGDHEVQADKLLARILKLRIFPDDAGKMNCSLQPAGSGRQVCLGWRGVTPGGACFLSAFYPSLMLNLNELSTLNQPAAISDIWADSLTCGFPRRPSR
jgi:hypothetical protein